MKTSLKRLLALLMVLTLIFALVPAVFADDYVDDDDWLLGFGEDDDDYEEAIKWFTMAAQHGEAKAMYELGSIYNDSSDFGGRVRYSGSF